MLIAPFLAGLALLIVGAQLLVRGATRVAAGFGISPLIVGLTVVAFGTSAPVFAVTLKGVLSGQGDIALGNVVGSNLFDVMGVLGLSGIVAPEGIAVSGAVHFDLPIMIVVAFACLPIFFTDAAISRAEGVLFLGFYVAYTIYLVLAAGQHDMLPAFSAVMLYFAIPLTLITLVVVAAREIRRRCAQRLLQ